MKLKTLVGIAALCGTALLASPPSPRLAKELNVSDPSGKKLELTRHPGEVVIVQFLYTTCSHCAATARLFTKLQKELGPRGLRIVGVAFNEESQAGPEAVRNFITENQVGFPVGSATRDAAMNYLGLSVMTRFSVPQVVVIDRKGMVRAQSEPIGSPELQDEARLRPLLEQLLKEKQ